MARTSATADEAFMRRAVKLARSGTGATYPNPCVGAVIVRAGRVVAARRSGPTGGPHAERRALRQAGDLARGAVLYVTLEPCCHHGRTPPCTDAIREARMARVVCGVGDPACHARGRGLRELRAAGIRVDQGVLALDCARAHEHYLHHVTTGLPFVSLKTALSLDGSIATSTGSSKWITGERARRHGHRLRAEHHAIAIGAATVLADDPRLDVRHVRGVDPVPVVFDGRLVLARKRRRPKLLREGTLVLHTSEASAADRRALSATGAEAVRVRADARGRVSIRAALRALGDRCIRSLLVEGGGGLHGAFVAARAWNRMFVYHAPVLLGQGKPMLGGLAWKSVARAPRLEVERRLRLGDDLVTVLRPPAER